MQKNNQETLQQTPSTEVRTGQPEQQSESKDVILEKIRSYNRDKENLDIFGYDEAGKEMAKLFTRGKELSIDEKRELNTIGNELSTAYNNSPESKKLLPQQEKIKGLFFKNIAEVGNTFGAEVKEDDARQLAEQTRKDQDAKRIDQLRSEIADQKPPEIVQQQKEEELSPAMQQYRALAKEAERKNQGFFAKIKNFFR